MKVIYSYITVFAILLLISSCTSNKEVIIGQWEWTSGTIRYNKLEFLKSQQLGIGNVNVTRNEIMYGVVYDFTGRNQIRLRDSNMGSDFQTYKIEISKNILILIDLSDGSVLKYKRVR